MNAYNNPSLGLYQPVPCCQHTNISGTILPVDCYGKPDVIDVAADRMDMLMGTIADVIDVTVTTDGCNRCNGNCSRCNKCGGDFCGGHDQCYGSR